MYEYLFFEPTMRQRFVDYLHENEVECEVEEEEGLVKVPETVDDDLAERIDDEYDKLLQMTGELLADTDLGLDKDVAGVQVALADGSPCTIRLDPEIMGRVLDCLSMEEFRDLCQAIAVGVERRDDRPICQIEDVELDEPRR